MTFAAYRRQTTLFIGKSKVQWAMAMDARLEARALWQPVLWLKIARLTWEIGLNEKKETEK
jgi:hypothetical protein